MTPQAQTAMRHDSASSGFAPPQPGASAVRIVRILAGQGAIGIVAAALAWLAAGPVAGISALVGAAICVLPGALLGGWVATSMLFGAAPRLQLHTFYVGEVLKLAATVVLFTAVFRSGYGFDPLFLFCGFIVTQAAMIGVLLRG